MEDLYSTMLNRICDYSRDEIKELRIRRLIPAAKIQLYPDIIEMATEDMVKQLVTGITNNIVFDTPCVMYLHLDKEIDNEGNWDGVMTIKYKCTEKPKNVLFGDKGDI